MHEDNYWQAVLTRDKRLDGNFVYAVRSTGIYSKPSCPARRPKREQVVFFSQPEAAVQAGFRSCRRCQPQDTHLLEPQVELVQRACSYIDAHLDEPITLATLGQQVGSSPYHLQRIFKHVMGISPRQYVEAARLGQLKTQLKGGESVTRVLYEVGYSSSSRLYERTPAQLGMTPTAYRRGGLDMQISYTIVDCPLGRLLAAATEKGVCAVSLGDSDEFLETALLREYPAAEIHRDGADLGLWVNAILNHLSGQQPHLDLPLDIQATAFQWRIWEELRNTPYGRTRSYSQIARAVGQPKATRAVAHACATNRVAIVIPCHRVVREDGNADGYRWGIERKQRLLEQERTIIQVPITAE